MKPAYLIQLLLVTTVVSLPAARATSTELDHLAAEKSTTNLISRASSAKDLSGMKVVQKGGYQADSFQLAESSQTAPASSLSDGVTTLFIGNTVVYMNANGQFMGLATP